MYTREPHDQCETKSEVPKQTMLTNSAAYIPALQMPLTVNASSTIEL